MVTVPLDGGDLMPDRVDGSEAEPFTRLRRILTPDRRLAPGRHHSLSARGSRESERRLISGP